MKKYLLTLALMAMTAFSVTTLRADDTNAPAAHQCGCSGHECGSGHASTLPPASLDQRISALEAYIANSDPTAPLKDTNGNRGRQRTPIIGNPGPGHNAWLLTSTALVLFMTLPGLALFYGGMVRRRTCCPCLRNAS